MLQMHLYQKAAFLISSINWIITTSASTLYYLLFLFLTVWMTWTQLHYLRKLTYLSFIDIFFSHLRRYNFGKRRNKTCKCYILVHFCLLLLCIKIACLFLCFQLALTSLESWKFKISWSVSGATWTEPMKRKLFIEKGTFPKQRLKPRTYLFISLVHSFVALPFPSFWFLLGFFCIMVEPYYA